MKKIMSKIKAFLLGPEITPLEDLNQVPDYEAQTLAMIALLEKAFDTAIEKHKKRYEDVVGDMFLMNVLASAARDKINDFIGDKSAMEYPGLFEAYELLTRAINIVNERRVAK